MRGERVRGERVRVRGEVESEREGVRGEGVGGVDYSPLLRRNPLVS